MEGELAGARTRQEVEGTNETTSGGFPQDDPGLSAIYGGSPCCEDAGSQCCFISSRSNSRGSHGSRGLRPEISPLPGRFRIGSHSLVELADGSTPDGHTTEACQPSQRTGQDAVCIQQSERHSLRPDLATRVGGRNNRTAKPISFDTTPESSLRGPDRVATAKHIMREIKQKNNEFSP